MRTLPARLTLLSLLLVALPAAALPGDVAPAGEPDELINIGDVLLALNMSVGASEVDLNADVSPTSPFGSWKIVSGDGRVDVADVLLLLRVAVGLELLAGGVDVDTEARLAHLAAARFAFDGFWTTLTDTLTLDQQPPLNRPTLVDCEAGGQLAILLTTSRQTIEAQDCDNGEFLINGRVSRDGDIQDPIFDADAEFVLEHDDGTLTMSGTIVTQPEVEFEPDRFGSRTTALLAVTSTYPAAGRFPFEVDVIDPEDGAWPIGRTWVAPPRGPAIRFDFDGSSTGTATVSELSGTRTYTIDLETGQIDESV